MTPLLKWACDEAAKIRGVAEVDPDGRLREIGFESRHALELVAALEQKLGRPVPATLPWQYPTLREMVDWATRARDQVSNDNAQVGQSLEPLAVVGIGCRYPGGCDDPERLWTFLMNGGNAITEVPGDRWDIERYFHEDVARPGKMSTRFGGFLEDIGGFDAAFFSVAPREARHMDPQQRIFLEVAWAGLEDAGIPPGSLRGTDTGVFVGSMWQEYGRLAAVDAIAQHSATGYDNGITAARLAYVLGLNGPAFSVNTACSSSLVAVHLASDSLRRGESRLAVVGGVNLMVSPEATVAMTKFGGMSPTGQCRAFDRDANGYVRAEGCAVVVLQRLADALADNRRIYALIHGSAVNNDGASNGLTAPSVDAQVDVVRKAWRAAGIGTSRASYVEAHGTGTNLGDPIEARALGTVFASERDRPLLVGSVKTNLGHTEAAAGVTGLIKASLCIAHGQVPASRHFDHPNPKIPFDELKLAVPTSARRFAEPSESFVGVSSFGFGGTNCHVVVGPGPGDPPPVLRLGAPSVEALQELARQALAELKPGRASGEPATLRSALEQRAPSTRRVALSAESTADLQAQLEALCKGDIVPATVAASAPRIAFVFSGHGGQWRGMGRQLWAHEAVFRATLSRCARAIVRAGGPDVIEELMRPGGDVPTRTASVQPVIFALQVALTALLRARGIEPAVVMGQSIGEVAACVAARALSVEEGAEVITRQSALISEHLDGTGAMILAVIDPALLSAIVAELGDDLVVSNELSAGQVTLSGRRAAIASAERRIQAAGGRVYRVAADYAAHTADLERVRAPLMEALATLRAKAPEVPLWSTAADGWLEAAPDASYWCSNLRQPVRIACGIEALDCQGPTLFVEIGPSAVLEHAFRDGLQQGRYVAVCRRGVSGQRSLDAALGQLWSHGHGALADLGGEPTTVPPVLLSAPTEAGLQAQAAGLVEHLNRHPELSWVDVARTLAEQRSHHRCRAALRGTDGAVEQLAALAEGQQSVSGVVRGTSAGRDRRVAFLFTGQGSQRAQMGRRLYQESALFRAHLDEVAEAFRPHLGRPLFDVLFAEAETDDAALLDQTGWTQPALFALEVALARTWQAWAVAPDLLVGHSIGEIAAAHIAGVMDLEDACTLVAARATAMQALPGGAMASLGATEADAMALAGDEVSLAALNAPGQTVVAGTYSAIDGLIERADAAGIKARRLQVSHAFHSAMMEPMMEGFIAKTGQLRFRPAQIPLVSNVTGRMLAPEDLCDAAYWARHLRGAVRFTDCVEVALQEGVDTFIEVGPRPSLCGLVARCAQAHDAAPSCLPSLRRGEDDLRDLSESLMTWHASGGHVDWEAVFSELGGRPVRLPTYRFAHQHYWLEGGAGRAEQGGLGHHAHPWLGRGGPLADSTSRVYTAEISRVQVPFLADHRVFDQVIVPGTALLETARAAARELDTQDGTWHVADLTIHRPLQLANEDGASGVALQTSLRRGDAGEGTLRIHSAPVQDNAPRGQWTLHASARLLEADPHVNGSHAAPGMPPADEHALDVSELYDDLAELGLGYGDGFRCLRAAWRDDRGLWAKLELPEVLHGTATPYGLHPALLDSALHAVFLALREDTGAPLDHVMVPFEWRGYRAPDPSRDPCAPVVEAFVHVTRVRCARDSVQAALDLYDEAGVAVAHVDEITMRRADRAALTGVAAQAQQAQFRLRFQPVGLQAPDELPGAWNLYCEDASHPWLQPLQALLESTGGRVTLLDDLPPVLPEGRLVCLWTPGPGAFATTGDGGADIPGLSQRLGEQGLAMLQRLVAPPAAERLSLPPNRSLAPRPRGPGRITWLTAGCSEADGPKSSPESGHWVARALWGMARTARHEHPELDLTLIDLEPGQGALCGKNLDALWLALRSRGEPEVAIRDGATLAARLIARGDGDALELPQAGGYQLKSEQKGSLRGLRFVPTEPTEPRQGQVAVEVRACALNFRDVMDALGMYGGQDTLENDFAGVVTAVGQDVADLRVGQRVFGMATGALGNGAVAERQLVAPVPEGLSFEQAATLPIAFLTALYALEDLAKLKPGERVVIHSAAGGVGMAAVQLAKSLGAEVFATASPGKWPMLKALGIDLDHIASSRDTAFGERFPKVNVVLNSLAGEFVDAGLGLLGEGGRFIEIGKTDVRDPDAVAERHPGVFYRQFILFEAGPVRLQELLLALSERLERGELRPPRFATWPMTEAVDAFRQMAQGKHVGKLVLKPPSTTTDAGDGLVLITGGFGALAGHAAKALVRDHGVRHLALVSRRGPLSEGAAERMRDLEALGARVTAHACDLADGQAVAQLVADLQRERPLRGVVHTAAVLDDGTLATSSGRQLGRVLEPKLHGAWHLHQATRELPLEFFVLYSSAAGTVGNAGQVSYNAANTALDALAEARHGAGLAATSVAWGLWIEDDKGAGIAAGLGEADRQRMLRQGLGRVTPELGDQLLAAALRDGPPAMVAMELPIAGVRAALRQLGAGIPPLLRNLIQERRKGTAGKDLRERLLAMPAEARRGTLVDAVRDTIAKVLGMPDGGQVDPSRPLKELGIDSLMAVELRNQLARVGAKALPATLAFDYPTAEKIADFLLEQATLGASVPPQQASALSEVTPADDTIAIVSMACRFPGGADTPEALWQLLCEGRDAISEIPSERWDVDRYFDPDPDAVGKTYSRWGGFLPSLECFDAGFFGISAVEAPSIDPQLRLLLETTWEALERQGVPPESLRGSDTGVYCGVIGTEYLMRTQADHAAIDAYSFDAALSAQTGRLSYVLGLEGPNFPVDTACSSSLVALHLACQGLRNDECSMAIVGGVNVLLDPAGYLTFSRLHAMSPSGRCHAFSERADGYVRAEGCGVLVLKRLGDARRDGDNVLALIRGSAINQDGRSSSPTAPNGPSQQRVIRQALARAGVAGRDVDFVECHGTGTPLGDPIEVQALAAVYGEGRDANQPLVLGSIKSNIGHTEAAAGIAGVIKAVLALQHGMVPRTLHVGRLNSHVAWDTLPVQVASQPVPQTDRGRSLRCGVSSFGVGGTNAHAVLEQAPPASSKEPSVRAPGGRDLLPILLSARTAAALRAQAKQLADYLRSQPGRPVRDVSHVLATGRTHFAQRAAIVIEDGPAAELERSLRMIASSEPMNESAKGSILFPPRGHRGGRLAFLFSGQGSQLAAMGRRLYEAVPRFRDHLDEITECFCGARDGAQGPMCDFSVRDLMFADAGTDEAAELRHPGRSQPALFALEVALARLLQAWGIRPQVVIGHSVGELAAAHIAGVFDLPDACRLVAARSQLMERLVVGKMAAVFASAGEVQDLLRAAALPDLHVALLNSPTQTVVSGDAASIERFVKLARAKGYEASELGIPGAGHSPLIDPILEPLREVASSIAYRAPSVPVISNGTGAVAVPDDIASADYWIRHVREAVRFVDCVATASDIGVRAFLEIGPRASLVRMAQQCLAPNAQGTGEEHVYLACLSKRQEDWGDLLMAVSRLHVCGIEVAWKEVLAGVEAAPVVLPTYPFERRRHWLPRVERLVDREHDAGASRFGEGVMGALAAAGHDQAQVVPLDLDLANLPRLHALWTEAAHGYLLGLCPTDGRPFDAQAVVAHNGIGDQYQRLVPRWLRILAQARLLDEVDGHFERRAASVAGPASRLDSAEALAPQHAGWTRFLRRCGQTFRAVLCGDKSGLDNLFPDGSLETADHIYASGPDARYMNGIIKAIVSAALAQPESHGGLRMLEVGAGTGGTTSALAPILPAGTTYHFTDLSDFFFRTAKRRLSDSAADYRFERLDLERPLQEQGLTPGSFDLVLASNVIHATADVRRTLGALRRALRPGGILLAWEVTEHPPWFEFSTTQIEGWNLANDDLRSEVPLLPAATWRQLLAELGFQQVHSFPGEEAATAVLGEHILLAQAPPAADAEAPAPFVDRAQAGVGAQDKRDTPQRTQLTPLDPATLSDLSPEARSSRLTEDLCTLLSSFLGLDEPIPPEASLSELGLDSLLAIELRRVLKDRYGVVLLPGELASHPTPATLSSLLSALIEAATRAPGEQAIAQVVEATLARHGRAAGVGPSSERDLLALDELVRAAVFADLTQAFDIEIPARDLLGIATVRDLRPGILRSISRLTDAAARTQNLAPSPAFLERYEVAASKLLGAVEGVERRLESTELGRMEVFRVGAGEPLLLLPPLNGSALIWFNQLHALGRYFQVIAPNYPGYGCSTLEGPASLDGLVRALGQLIERLEIEHFHVAGWSMGGALAQLFARDMPARIRSLTLVNTSSFMDMRGDAKEFAGFLRLLDGEYASYPGARCDVGGLDAQQVALGVRGNDRIDLSFLYFSMVATGDFRPALEQAQVPTLVVSGEADRITPIEHGLRMAELSGGQHQIVPQVAH
ncbi:MAG: alpha/beta fold hydrolase, partial [Myxococcales bacterium]|nr:alpha/beta fold hydrolase [Myxococcales bacterium]